jgi:hypothetical protein
VWLTGIVLNIGAPLSRDDDFGTSISKVGTFDGDLKASSSRAFNSTHAVVSIDAVVARTARNSSHTRLSIRDAIDWLRYELSSLDQHSLQGSCRRCQGALNQLGTIDVANK